MATEAAAATRSRAHAIPAWAWIAGIVVVSAIVRYGLSRRMVAPWIMVDELLYSELAKSFADGGRFAVRGVADYGLGFVYPALIAPAFRIASIPDAYAVAKALNGVLMSLAAIPAYLLARRVVGTTLAILVAALTIAVPSMAYTGTLMTENVFYPLFLCVALMLVWVLERPTWWNQVLLLGLCGLAFATRAQAIALVPAVLTAPILYDRGRVLAYRWLYALAGAGVVLVAAYELARGRSLTSVLGAYRAATNEHYDVPTVLRWLVYHVAELDLYLGIVPFAALLVLGFTMRSLWRGERAFVAAAISLSAWLVLEVAIFASAISLRVEERNMFYVAPLFFVALAIWIERGLPRGAPAVVAALVAAAIPGVIPFSTLLNGNAVSDTLAFLPLIALQRTLIADDQVATIVVVAAIALAALFLFVPRRYALALPLAVLGLYAVELVPIESRDVYGIQHASLGALFGGITWPDRDWVDRTIGRDGNVAFVWSGSKDKFTLWQNEFFNRSVRDVYYLGERSPGNLPETSVRIDRRDGRFVGAREAPYVLTDDTVRLAGSVVARDRVKGMILYRVTGPLRLADAVAGVNAADSWSGRTATYTRFRCHGGAVTAFVESDRDLFPRGQVVAAGGRRVRVQPGGTSELTVPLQPAGGRCTVRFTVAPTAIPAIALHSTDTRKLGIHFTRFVFHG